MTSWADKRENNRLLMVLWVSFAVLSFSPVGVYAFLESHYKFWAWAGLVGLASVTVLSLFTSMAEESRAKSEDSMLRLQSAKAAKLEAEAALLHSRVKGRS